MGRKPGKTRERVFEFVKEQLLSGTPPTVREVQEAMGFSAVQTARQHLEALVKDGRLSVRRGESRGYRLPGKKSETTSMVPLLGRVAAGPLQEAVENVEGYIPITGRGGRVFALKVEGDSMKDAGILPGDVAIVRKQQRAESGEIVVAMVSGEATVKRLKLRGKRLELLPENDAYEPIRPSKDQVQILGKVIEIRRTLR